MDEGEHPLGHRPFLACRMRPVGSRHGFAIGETAVGRESCCRREASPCAAMSPAERIESAARLLRGACSEIGSNGTGKPTFSCMTFAGEQRLRRLRIHRDGLGRRPSPLGHPRHDQRSPVCPDGDVDRVPRPNGLRGLHALAVHAHPPPKDGSGRGVPRLEHSCCPEPLVDSHLIHSAMIAAARGPSAAREARARPRTMGDTVVSHTAPSSRRLKSP